MATQVQYDVFRAAADEESERYLGRECQAKLYLAIITAYLGAAAFKTTEFAERLLMTEGKRRRSKEAEFAKG